MLQHLGFAENKSSTIEGEMIPLPPAAGREDISLHTLLSTSFARSAEVRPVLLLLHFWGGSNRTFSRLVAALRNEYNIIAPSLRGWGDSSKPSDLDAYHIDDHVDDIAGLLTHLRTTRPDVLRSGVVVVGHSIGGKIAQVLLTRPQAAGLVKGLILIAPAPAGSLQLPEEMREVQVKAYDSAVSARGAIANVLLGKADCVSEDEVEGLVMDAMAGSPGAKAAWPAYGMGEDFEELVVAAVRKLPAGRLRVLVVAGDLDNVEPEASVRKRTVRMLEDAGAAVDVVRLEGVGHLIPIEAPTRLAEGVRSHLADVV